MEYKSRRYEEKKHVMKRNFVEEFSDKFLYLYHYIFNTFKFNGKVLHCFYHPYNNTSKNERFIELPIVIERMKAYSKTRKEILEIGNVISHYYSLPHVVVDKYESGKNILNIDAEKFNLGKKFDLIVSVSTLEHVGWDEEPQNPEKIFTVIKNIRKNLAIEGEAVITLPIGYNNAMDEMLKKDILKFDKEIYLKRITKENKWAETSKKDALNKKYGEPFQNANAILIGFLMG